MKKYLFILSFILFANIANAETISINSVTDKTLDLYLSFSPSDFVSNYNCYSFNAHSYGTPIKDNHNNVIFHTSIGNISGFADLYIVTNGQAITIQPWTFSCMDISTNTYSDHVFNFNATPINDQIALMSFPVATSTTAISSLKTLADNAFITVYSLALSVLNSWFGYVLVIGLLIKLILIFKKLVLDLVHKKR